MHINSSSSTSAVTEILAYDSSARGEQKEDYDLFIDQRKLRIDCHSTMSLQDIAKMTRAKNNHPSQRINICQNQNKNMCQSMKDETLQVSHYPIVYPLLRPERSALISNLKTETTAEEFNTVLVQHHLRTMLPTNHTLSNLYQSLDRLPTKYSNRSQTSLNLPPLSKFSEHQVIKRQPVLASISSFGICILLFFIAAMDLAIISDVNSNSKNIFNLVEAVKPSTSQVNLCQVYNGESVAIVEITESRGSEMNQTTTPIELPIKGSVSSDEIELKIESETHKYFYIQGKQLRLHRPLDRDGSARENSTNSITSIYLQVLCVDKRSQHKKIIPVLVKVLDLNDNAPVFSAPTYTVSVNELTSIGSVVFDQIFATDLDSGNNGLIDYSLVPSSYAASDRITATTIRAGTTTTSTIGPSTIGSTSVASSNPAQIVKDGRYRTMTLADMASITTTSKPLIQPARQSQPGAPGTSQPLLVGTGAPITTTSTTNSVSFYPRSGSSSAAPPPLSEDMKHMMILHEDITNAEDDDETINTNDNGENGDDLMSSGSGQVGSPDSSEEFDNRSVVSAASLPSSIASAITTTTTNNIATNLPTTTTQRPRILRRRAARAHYVAQPPLPISQQLNNNQRSSWRQIHSVSPSLKLIDHSQQAAASISGRLRPVASGQANNQQQHDIMQQVASDTLWSVPISALAHDPTFEHDNQQKSTIKSDGFDYFTLELAPNTSRPVIKLKKPLDYEENKLHYLTIRAIDKSLNAQDRLWATATLIIKVTDGDDQGPMFLLEPTQSGDLPPVCPESTFADPSGQFDNLSQPEKQQKLFPGSQQQRVKTSTQLGDNNNNNNNHHNFIGGHQPTVFSAYYHGPSVAQSLTMANNDNHHNRPQQLMRRSGQISHHVGATNNLLVKQQQQQQQSSSSFNRNHITMNQQQHHQRNQMMQLIDATTNTGDSGGGSGGANMQDAGGLILMDPNTGQPATRDDLMAAMMESGASNGPDDLLIVGDDQTIMVINDGSQQQQQGSPYNSNRSRQQVDLSSNTNDPLLQPINNDNQELSINGGGLRPGYNCIPSDNVDAAKQMMMKQQQQLQLQQPLEYRSTIISGDADYNLRIYPQAIKARDRDELNAQIKYTFYNGTPSNYSNYFQINSLDGTIKQIKPVDRSVVKRFVVWIQAQEQTANKLNARAKLTIEVEATDKNPPVLIPNSHNGLVDENSPVGTMVMVNDGVGHQSMAGLAERKPLRITVTDVDLLASGDSEAQMQANYEFETTSQAFRVNKDGYLMVNQANLDRDAPNPSVYIIQVAARQVGIMSSKSVSAPIRINVTLADVNDNSPTIDSSSLIPLKVPASNGGTRTIKYIRGLDLDGDEANSKIIYSIYHVSNNGRDKFRIDQDSGKLEAIGKFSAGEQYSLTLQVSDQANRFSQGILEIFIIQGPNTRPPVFQTGRGERISVEISEGISLNSQVVQVSAIDPENEPIKYSIVDGNINNDFSMDSKSGWIHVANKLDREEVSAYNLLVEARDQGGLASTTSVMVIITDINDENPKFTSAHYTFRVEEGVSHQIIGQVLARDADSGDNGELSYSLSSKIEGSNKFQVDEKTGELSVVEPLDYETEKVHNLVVTATDHGEHSRLATTSVTIRVVDRQDELPQFDKIHLQVNVPENAVNYKVAIVHASDPDTLPQVTYTMRQGDSSLFSVDPLTGLVQTIKGLDYESAKTHTIIVGTLENNSNNNNNNSNNNNNPQQGSAATNTFATCQIDILVVDLNDNTPTFYHTPLPVRIQDSVALGSVVTTLQAIDNDGVEPNNQIRYEIVSRGADRSWQYFMIDSTTGTISVKDDLRKDLSSESRLVIRAKDLGQPSLSSTTILTVYIDHLAEISPESLVGFADTHYTVELEENSPARSLIKILPVINKPKINFPISCEIVSGNELGKFFIMVNDQRDCEIRTMDNNIDYEQKQKFILAVKLNTIGGSSKTMAQVNVNILDINDNRPIFMNHPRYSHLTGDRFLTAVANDAPSDTQMMQLKAFDADSSASNGLVTYEILNESDVDSRFKIDPSAGILRTSRPVEDIALHRLPLKIKVVARDNPELLSSSLYSLAEVVINLIDDRHRIALVLKDTPPSRVLDSREELLSIIQERTGLIPGLEKAESLKIQRNGSIDADVTGTDAWFYLIEPTTFRIIPSDDPRVKSTIFDTKAQNSILNIVSQTLGFNAARIRHPYVPLVLSRIQQISPSRLGMSTNDVGSALIAFGLFMAIVTIIGIVYQCRSWSKHYANSSPKKVNPHHHSSYYHNGSSAGTVARKLATINRDYVQARSGAFQAIPRLSNVPDPIFLDQHQQYPKQPTTLKKEYETQMLKMTVPFDDNFSVDERDA